jgi:hypothetical protein
MRTVLRNVKSHINEASMFVLAVVYGKYKKPPAPEGCRWFYVSAFLLRLKVHVDIFKCAHGVTS